MSSSLCVAVWATCAFDGYGFLRSIDQAEKGSYLRATQVLLSGCSSVGRISSYDFLRYRGYAVVSCFCMECDDGEWDRLVFTVNSTIFRFFAKSYSVCMRRCV